MQEYYCIMTIWIPDISGSFGPRYKAIVEALEEAIQSKQLQPGQRLPTQRELAYKLGLSVQTVSRAYAEAERRGLTSGEIGRGTFVQYLKPEQGANFIADSQQANYLDFSNIMPVVSDTHVEALKQAMIESAKDSALARMLEYRPTQGTAPHRQAGAQWLQRNGVAVDPENVIITNGAAHGIWTAMASLAEPGEVVCSEELVDSSIITNASILKTRLRGLALDAEGIIPESLEEACEREPVKLLCVTPCFNDPTASLMGEARREKIAELARRYDVAIIEDDVFGPLIPNRPKPLWCFAPERTYYVTSFSKAVMSALRTGYLTGPSHMMPRLVSRLRTTGWMANTWTAEVATRWLYDGTAERLIAWQRKTLKARHEMLGQILAAYECASHPNAMHAWLTLPEQWRSRHFVEQARSRGLLVTPPDPFIVGRTAEPHAVRLALGDTNRDDADFARGLRRIAALLQEDPEPFGVHY
jgi:DNA-binding transcriptional MocR family regulator